MTCIIHKLTRLGSLVTSPAASHLHRLPLRLLPADAVSAARIAALLTVTVAVGTAGVLTGHPMATSLLVVGAIGATWLTLWTATGGG
jgi:hypothetical protein